MKVFRFLVPAALLLAACSPVAPESPEDAPTIGMPVIDENGNPSSVDEMVVTEDAGGDGDAMSAPGAAAETRVIRMTATNWAFSPASITLKKGERVTIELTGIEGDHGFSAQELGVNERVEPGQTVTVALPTDTTGTFSFFCNVPCGSGHKDMRGTITIEE